MTTNKIKQFIKPNDSIVIGQERSQNIKQDMTGQMGRFKFKIAPALGVAHNEPLAATGSVQMKYLPPIQLKIIPAKLEDVRNISEVHGRSW